MAARPRQPPMMMAAAASLRLFLLASSSSSTVGAAARAGAAATAAVADAAPPPPPQNGGCFLRTITVLGHCRRFHGVDTWTLASGTWTRHADLNCFQSHGAVDLSGNLGSNYTLQACEATCIKTPKCTAVCTLASVTPPPPPKPELPFVDVFGSTTQICTGAQMVATRKSLLVWGECQIKPEPRNPDDPKNLEIQLRRSTDGVNWGPVLPQPFPPPYLSQVIYDPATDAVISVGPCPGSPPPPNGDSLTGCGSPFPCWSKSTDEGSSWSAFTPAGKGNGTFGGAEGSLGTTLSTGNLLSPFSVKSCSPTNPPTNQVNRVLISADHGATWQVGGPTPAVVDGKPKPWGESAVAELANGSVVLTSRLSQPLTAGSRWRGFAISHTGGQSWEKAWTFPADEPFDKGFGPGYNCESALISVKNRTKLLLSKPTATLHGDSTGAPHSRCSPGN